MDNGVFSFSRKYVNDVNLLERIEDLGALTHDFLNRLGFSYYACCSHVDYKNMPFGGVLLHNYPTEWTEIFREMHYEQYDPIQRFAGRSLLPFYWNDKRLLRSLNKRQAGLLEKAGQFGLKFGYTVPIHLPGHFTASFSVAGQPEAFTDDTTAAVQLVAPFLYQRLRTVFETEARNRNTAVLLTDQERNYLSLVAQGKSDWSIAQICGASRSAVAHSIERVRSKFGVATRTQAVALALHQGHLAFDVVLKNTASI